MKNSAICKFETISELLKFQAQSYDNPHFLNFTQNNKSKSFSNKEFLEQSFFFACGLKEIGFKAGEKLANFSYQNPIWLIVDFGTILVGGVTVPIFSNISKEHLIHQLNHSEAGYIFSDNEDLRIEDLQITKINFDEIIKLGKESSKNYDINDFVNIAKPDDLATIIYTSGSTGNPKGVEITHKNLISQVKDTAEFFPLNKSDVALSFLPLAHIFERMVTMFYISSGISVYFADDIKNLGKSLKEVRPTLMTTVPRMLEKVFAKINDGADNAFFLKKYLAKKAIKRALTKAVEQKRNFLDLIFDILVFKKLRQSLGGNMRMIICGGASLSNDMEKFYQNIGIKLYCGYGLTETSPVLSANCPKNYKFGSVGKKFSSVELKIADDNELLAKGPNIMKAYHKDEKATNEVIKDGWFLTGDLAQIDEEGFVKIIGRKKELFKTSNGKYVYPIAIEQKIMQKLGFLIGAIVIAEGRNFVSALLFADFENLEKIKKKLKFNENDEEFLSSKKLEEFVNSGIETVNKSLDNWQKVKKFKIITKPISIESGEITPSMKLKRPIIEEKFHDEIEEIYSK